MLNVLCVCKLYLLFFYYAQVPVVYIQRKRVVLRVCDFVTSLHAIYCNSENHVIHLTLSAGFLAEVRSLRQRYDPALPVLVHCSAGVGRSGVVVLMDMLMAKVNCGDVSPLGNILM